MILNTSKVRTGVIVLGSFVLGILLCLGFSRLGGSDKMCASSYGTFINPYVACLDADEVSSQIQKRQLSMQTYIDSQVAAKKISRTSVYVRDLDTLKWFGVNPHETYSPGSLLKLPLAIAYYKLAELDPAVLSQKIVYTASTLNELEYFQAQQTLVPGNQYTVEELIYKMLVNSDNTVVPLLFKNLNQDFYKKVLLDLQIVVPSAEDGGVNADFFSVVTYSAMLRSLYNSSYLQSEYSSHLLKILSESTFKEGLVKGVPAGTKIAHKFGEVDAVDPTNKKSQKVELHDCGIVYREKGSYIICVSTEGQDFEVLSDIIAHLSELAWND